MIFQMSKIPGFIRRASPDTDGDTHAIRRELGYDEAKIELRAKNAGSHKVASQTEREAIAAGMTV